MKKARRFDLINKIFILTILIFAVVETCAAVFNVNSNADPGDGVCNQAECTLREAVTAANNSAGDDLIEFNAALNNMGVNLLTALPPIAENLAINTINPVLFTVKRAPAATGDFSILTIDADVNSTALTVTLNRLRINDGTGNVDVDGFRRGGIFNRGGNLIVTNSFIERNAAEAGGGIHCTNGASQIANLSIDNTLIATSTVTTTDPDFSPSGGGINFNALFSSLTITNSRITTNRIINSNGGATTGSGGGISKGSGTLTITNTQISGNGATGGGGGIIGVNAAAVITGSSITGNFAGLGGGIINNGSTMNVANTTIANNQATGSFGGGYYAEGSNTFVNVTITGNTAFIQGGGIYRSFFSSSCALGNTIVADNEATNTTSKDLHGTFISNGNNLIRISDGGTGFTNAVNGDIVGTGANPLNAMLDTLANYGGATLTIQLLAGSPAINAGNNALAANAGLTNDQRGAGFVRVSGLTVDIGAFERQATPPTAAMVSVGGRVLTANGRSIRNARVTLIEASGAARTSVTNAFGFYHFAEVAAGQTVIVEAERKGFQFAPQFVTVAEELENLNFIAQTWKF